MKTVTYRITYSDGFWNIEKPCSFWIFIWYKTIFSHPLPEVIFKKAYELQDEQIKQE